MSVYHKSTALANEIREKRNILRERYGGMMERKDLMIKLGYKTEKSAVRAAQEMGILPTQIGKSKKYDTDTVARRLIELRGMC